MTGRLIVHATPHGTPQDPYKGSSHVIKNNCTLPYWKTISDLDTKRNGIIIII